MELNTFPKFEKSLTESKQFARDLINSNPLFVRAADGSLTREQVAQFLENVRYMITFTVPHLTRAAEVAEQRGLLELAAAYREEIEEERGHEMWAESDLSRIAADQAPISVRPVKATKKLVELVKNAIEEDPAVLMAYAFFIENLTLDIGPKLMFDIETNCGISREMLSVIGNHVKLDSGHAVEGQKAIEAFLTLHPEREDGFQRIARNASEIFSRLCTEVCGNTDH
jgi:pyrroloquinoline quinone (PQQ) biosynthesis protein C